MNGGYYMLDCKGLDLTKTDPQNIPGCWADVKTALASGKPIIAHNCVYGDADVSPVTCFGWAISATEVVIVGGKIYFYSGLPGSPSVFI